MVKSLMQLARSANNATHAQTSQLQTAMISGHSTKTPARVTSVVCTALMVLLQMLIAQSVKPVTLAQDWLTPTAQVVKCSILPIVLVSTNIVTFKFAKKAKFWMKLRASASSKADVRTSTRRYAWLVRSLTRIVMDANGHHLAQAGTLTSALTQTSSRLSFTPILNTGHLLLTAWLLRQQKILVFAQDSAHQVKSWTKRRACVRTNHHARTGPQTLAVIWVEKLLSTSLEITATLLAQEVLKTLASADSNASLVISLTLTALTAFGKMFAIKFQLISVQLAKTS
jgi:hypothetical protein